MIILLILGVFTLGSISYYIADRILRHYEKKEKGE